MTFTLYTFSRLPIGARDDAKQAQLAQGELTCEELQPAAASQQ